MMINAGFSAILATALALVTVHDFRHMRVPDHLNIAIAVSGVCFWVLANPDLAGKQLFSGAAFGCAIWLLRESHKRISGRIGLGMGDVKLCAAGAIWLNPVLLPLFLFTASLTGLAYTSAVSLTHRRNIRHERIPFAPFLSASMLFCWMVERWP